MRAPSPFLRAFAAALSGTAALFTGCASSTGIPRRPWDALAELKQVEAHLTGDVLARYHQHPSLAARTAYRDEVTYARLRAIDVTYAAFVSGLTRERNLQSVASDTSVLALNGAAAIVTPAGTKSILAAISGGIVGIKGSIDKHLFYEKTMPVLLTQMEALRKQKLAAILAGLAAPADKYGLTQALIDLEDYYQAGTIPQALVAINAQSGVVSQDASTAIKGLKVQALSYGALDDEDVANAIRQWLTQGGNTWNADRRRELQDWLAARGIDVPIPGFLSGPFKEQRDAFVTEKSIPRAQ